MAVFADLKWHNMLILLVELKKTSFEVAPQLLTSSPWFKVKKNHFDSEDNFWEIGKSM